MMRKTSTLLIAGAAGGAMLFSGATQARTIKDAMTMLANQAGTRGVAADYEFNDDSRGGAVDVDGNGLDQGDYILSTFGVNNVQVVGTDNETYTVNFAKTGFGFDESAQGRTAAIDQEVYGRFAAKVTDTEGEGAGMNFTLSALSDSDYDFLGISDDDEINGDAIIELNEDDTLGRSTGVEAFTSSQFTGGSVFAEFSDSFDIQSQGRNPMVPNADDLATLSDPLTITGGTGIADPILNLDEEALLSSLTVAPVDENKDGNQDTTQFNGQTYGLATDTAVLDVTATVIPTPTAVWGALPLLGGLVAFSLYRRRQLAC